MNKSSLFQWAALLDGLMPLQGVLAGESLSTRLAKERLFPVMRISVSLQVVLTIEGQRTHIAGKRARRGSGILHGTVDRRLGNILRLGLAVRHLGRLGSVGF